MALITKAALGTSPISSLPYVLSLRFPVTLGQFTFLMNMLFILAQVLLLRKDFRPVQLLQVAVNVVFSLFIDVSMGLLSWMEVGVLPMRLLALAVGCAVLGFGISVEVAPLVSTALLLSLLFFHRLQGLGIGTIFSALAVGRFVDLYNRRLPLISRISALGART